VEPETARLLKRPRASNPKSAVGPPAGAIRTSRSPRSYVFEVWLLVLVAEVVRLP
jgi:hypothetical protein